MLAVLTAAYMHVYVIILVYYEHNYLEENIWGDKNMYITIYLYPYLDLLDYDIIA